MSASSLVKLVLDLPYIFTIFCICLIKSFKRKFNAKKSLNGEIVLVTGAASGIGQALVLKMARMFPSAVFVLWDINETELNVTAEKCKKVGNHNIHVYKVDVSKRDEIFRTASIVKREVGTVTVLVNNAGIIHYNLFVDTNPTMEEKLIQVNLLGVMWTTRAFLPDMISKGKGHVVSTCSIAGFYRRAYLSTYVASKFAVRGFMETLASEMRQHPKKPKITISTVYPTFIKTPMVTNRIAWKSRYEFSGLKPLDLDYVANSMLDGILKEKEEIMIPGSTMLAAFINRIMPTEFVDRMESFVQFDIKILKP